MGQVTAAPPHRLLAQVWSLPMLWLALGATAGLAVAKPPIEPLVAVLEEADDYKQRLAAVIGLGRVGDKRAVPALIDALEDEHLTVRGTAASVLGQLADRRAISALEALIKRAKHRFIRQQARRSLNTLLAISAAPAPRPASAPSTKVLLQMQVKGTHGTLARSEVQAGVKAVMPRAQACFASRFAAEPYLGGKLLLRLRVAVEGTVKWIRLERGDLGSLETERCVTGALQSARFAKPRGGEAEFTIPLSFGGSDPVTTIAAGQSPIAEQLRQQCGALLEGTGVSAAPSGLQVSLYISHRGAVVSAGLAARAELPAAFAERFVANLRRLTLPREQPASGHAKLVYRFACGIKNQDGT